LTWDWMREALGLRREGLTRASAHQRVTSTFAA
jgi:hypothetical protein